MTQKGVGSPSSGSAPDLFYRRTLAAELRRASSKSYSAYLAYKDSRALNLTRTKEGIALLENRLALIFGCLSNPHTAQGKAGLDQEYTATIGELSALREQAAQAARSVGKPA
ncbi:hypothetical protein CEB3_c31600 [Peptococcaceae bacterium CEB3]|nr:hypothetical protein CEB3_c31600 [Peptococcaceae bacterium CEB3]